MDFVVTVSRTFKRRKTVSFDSAAYYQQWLKESAREEQLQTAELPAFDPTTSSYGDARVVRNGAQ